MAAKKKSAAKKKAAATKAAPAAKAITQKMTRTQILQAIADETGLNRKQVGAVFESLSGLVERNLRPRGSGELTIPFNGMKVRRVRRPAQKARMGRNPATGEAVKIAAKPARTVVKVTALKMLKDKAG
ncbi:MAG: HU family DNA-binding protein [Chromatiales bacterium]|nr:HU family DNA-binding protein [Chromatiales bacterium]